jgi:hypothetical protein
MAPLDCRRYGATSPPFQRLELSLIG